MGKTQRDLSRIAVDECCLLMLLLPPTPPAVCPGGRRPSVCAPYACLASSCAGAALCRVDPCNDCRPVFMTEVGAIITDCQQQGEGLHTSQVFIDHNALTSILSYNLPFFPTMGTLYRSSPYISFFNILYILKQG